MPDTPMPEPLPVPPDPWAAVMDAADALRHALNNAIDPYDGLRVQVHVERQLMPPASSGFGNDYAPPFPQGVGEISIYFSCGTAGTLVGDQRQGASTRGRGRTVRDALRNCLFNCINGNSRRATRDADGVAFGWAIAALLLPLVGDPATQQIHENMKQMLRVSLALRLEVPALFTDLPPHTEDG